MSTKRQRSGVANTSALEVTPFGAPITPPSLDPYANTDVGGTAVRLGPISLPTQTNVTADQLRQIMPYAGAEADRYVEALNQAMVAYGINTPEQRAAFLAQVSVESRQLRDTVEDLNYSARRIPEVFRDAFPLKPQPCHTPITRSPSQTGLTPESMATVTRRVVTVIAIAVAG